LLNLLPTNKHANATKTQRHWPPRRDNMLASKVGPNSLGFQKCTCNVSFPRVDVDFNDGECNDLVQSSSQGVNGVEMKRTIAHGVTNFGGLLSSLLVSHNFGNCFRSYAKDSTSLEVEFAPYVGVSLVSLRFFPSPRNEALANPASIEYTTIEEVHGLSRWRK
jgi:hypothetical protein